MTSARRTSSWPAGTTVRDLPNGSQEITPPTADPSSTATSARCSASDEGQDRRPNYSSSSFKYLALGRSVNPSAS